MRCPKGSTQAPGGASSELHLTRLPLFSWPYGAVGLGTRSFCQRLPRSTSNATTRRWAWETVSQNISLQQLLRPLEMYL